MAQVQQIILPYRTKCSSCGIRGLGITAGILPSYGTMFAILGGALAVGALAIVLANRR